MTIFAFVNSSRSRNSPRSVSPVYARRRLRTSGGYAVLCEPCDEAAIVDLATRTAQALAELGEGLCEGCFVNLPKNIVVRLARGTELVQCPSCDRILFTY